MSDRDPEQVMGERGISVDHGTITRWVQRYAPEMEKRLRWQWRVPRPTGWHVDETCVGVRGVGRVGLFASGRRQAREQPGVINTDKAPAYATALAGLKKEAKCLNNVIKADHGKLKQPIRPVRGFKSLKTACATIKGFEVMRALRRGRASAFNVTGDIRGEARMVERAFGLGASALGEVVQLPGRRLGPEAA